MNSVITQKTREKMLKARAEGTPISKIVGFAVGDGGVNSSGTVKKPESDQNELNHELLRKPYESYEYIDTLICRYHCLLAEGELPGAKISEVALYDADGDLVCIKNFTPKGKDADLEMSIQIDDNFKLEVY